jgi:hypothetical protein
LKDIVDRFFEEMKLSSAAGKHNLENEDEWEGGSNTEDPEIEPSI